MSVEAIRVPSAGAIFWTEAPPDGSAATRAIAGEAPAIDVTLTAPLPRGIRAEVGVRGVVLLALPILYDHAPTQTELQTVPALPSISLQGIARARDGRFHPRRFTRNPTPAAPTYVPLRPSLQATRIGEAGAVVLSLRWQNAGPASWAIVSLSCTRNTTSFTFTAQADVAGDAFVPLTGLPPLPPGQTSDAMTLTVSADITQAGADAGDPDVLQPKKISIGAAFAAQQSLTVARGQITTGAMLGIPAIVLQAS